MKTKLGMEFIWGRVCLCGALALALTGCCGNKLWKPQEASSIQDAGAVHIAVLTVSTFEKYRENVQPQFTLSTDDALNQVLPSTLALEERVVNLLGLSLKVKAGVPSTTSAGTTTTSQSSNSSGPTAGTPTAASLPGGGSVTGATLGQDPLLKFWTAAALYQEVQLLNRYVQDAAIPEGFTAYVVRLQVSLLPWARNEPYDAYADISFFRGDFCHENRIEETPKCDGQTSQNEVRILPLLVTDDIEAALEARSYDRIRQLALALSAVFKGVGVKSNLESMNEQLQSVTGRDYNSAFTLARTSHNTLRVRFGAVNQAMARYSMIPQTHNVTLLLMVPKAMLEEKEVHGKTVRMVSRTAIVDAQDGKELDDKYSKYGPDEVLKVLAVRGIEKPVPPGELYSLQRYVAANDYAEFRKYVEDKLQKYVNQDLKDPKIRFVDSLWVDLASLRELSRYQTAILTLPEYKPVLGFEDQKPLLIDDGKSSISTKLVGIRDLNQKKLRVGLKASTCSDKDMKLLEETFKLLNKDAKVLEGTCKLGKLDEQGKVTFQPVPHKEVYLPATSIKPDVGDGEFLVTFPSLRALKQQPIDDEAKVVVSIGDERNLVYKHCREYPGVYAVMQKPPLFALSVLAGVINSDEHGQGTVVIDIQKAPDSDTFPATVAVKISGADFNVCKVTTNPTGILLPKEKDPAPDPKVLKVTKPGTVTLALFNLNPESDVTVSGTDDSGTSSTPITVRVVSLSASKQKKQE